MEKNKIYKGLVEGLGTGGEGIIKTEGTTAFVPFCLEGEEISFKALKVDGKIAYGKVENIIAPSPSRVAPPCPVFGKCGGCDLQHMDYAAQLAFKRQTVKSALSKIGGINFEVSETVPCGKEYRYRNKLALPIGNINGETVCGFYGLRSHRIVPTDDCLIQSEWVKKIISVVKKYSAVCGVPAYDELTGKGILRRIVVREIKGKYIFALVAAKAVNADCLIKELEKDFSDFAFLLNVNPSSGNALFSDEWRVIKGRGFFEAEECGIKYKAGANTFLQVNDDVRAKLYDAVLREVGEGDAALDLYSGGGMLTAMLAKKCNLAYGVEVVKEASLCAEELKTANGLDGKMFNICGKVEDEIDRVLSLTFGKRRVIVCDPPRKGMERSAVKAIVSAKPEKIILVSCNPATLARDLGLILGTLEERDGALVKTNTASGEYLVESITPFDMFPQTKHVETLVVLSHKKPDGHINVKVEFGEEVGQVSLKDVAKRAEERKPKEKVTYKMIQEYIEQTYGLKVHTAYIAEVKRDLGLPMYDAPNAVEELKRSRSHPIPKMVNAIKVALKHFEIID
ncbi:MAG: 23S rRNA (uracil(1939)-C(5))-methyltransferase RlmD [Clostridia bacterium]|nr:23S rRNA (uracil(1939)-C(5))-methyltransferase RlmD [Clostridia bacterium]